MVEVMMRFTGVTEVGGDANLGLSDKMYPVEASQGIDNWVVAS